MYDILIIGYGNVGSALYLALELAGYKCAVSDPYLEHEIPPASRVSLKEGLSAPLIFIAVPDDALSTLVTNLQNFNLHEKVVVHTSGLQPAAVINLLEGAYGGSLHPVQTFSRRNLPPQTWQGIICTFEGSDPAFSAVKEIVTALGTRLERVSAQQKAALHCAAVFAANYQVALLQSAEKILNQFQLDKSLLLPLIEQVRKNFSIQPANSILSGPLKRGDVQTIRKHLKLLEEEGLANEQALYKNLARYLLADPDFELQISEELREELDS